MARLSFLLVYCFLSISIAAQRMAEFQLDDKRALQIGEEELELLLDKKWYLDKYEYQERKGAEIVPMHSGSYITFRRDHFLVSKYNKKKWEMHPENTLIHINVIEGKTINKDYQLLGWYAFWEISDTNLILAKVLTSNQDQAIIYHFTIEPPKEYALVKDAKYLERRERLKQEAKSQKEAIKYEELIIDGEKVNVQKLERQDLFMRNIRPEKGFVYYHTESGKLIKIAVKE